MKILNWLAKCCAMVGGALLVAITLLTVVSVIGRDTMGKAIVGDFELTAAACGACIALFLPYCQAKQGNIIVDFFTNRASESVQSFLDRLGAFVLAIIMGILAWRAVLGGISAYEAQSGSMLLNFPEWVVYAFIVPGLTLTALIGLFQALFGFSQVDRVTADNPELSL
jgi:TRAP-type C4-dicarboxylate transport system permease small subunit